MQKSRSSDSGIFAGGNSVVLRRERVRRRRKWQKCSAGLIPRPAKFWCWPNQPAICTSISRDCEQWNTSGKLQNTANDTLGGNFGLAGPLGGRDGQLYPLPLTDVSLLIGCGAAMDGNAPLLMTSCISYWYLQGCNYAILYTDFQLSSDYLISVPCYEIPIGLAFTWRTKPSEFWSSWMLTACSIYCHRIAGLLLLTIFHSMTSSYLCPQHVRLCTRQRSISFIGKSPGGGKPFLYGDCSAFCEPFWVGQIWHPQSVI